MRLNTRCSEGASIEYCQGELDLQEGRLVLVGKYLNIRKVTTASLHLYC